MEQTTLSVPQNERLDHVIAQVAELHGDRRDLLLEHLQSARTYLLGAMPREYEFSLRYAAESAKELGDDFARESVAQDVAYLLQDAQVRARSTETSPKPSDHLQHEETDHAKSQMYQFFQPSGATRLAVFYPTHYIFAAFPSLQNARAAATALQAVGYQDVLAASAEETAQFFDELRTETGLLGALMANVSRFFGTEEVFADIDEREGHKGAGFLAIHCPKEKHAEQIRELVNPFEPLVMQLYLPGGIRSLHAGKFPGPQGHHPEEVSATGGNERP